jgi:hypothetical protein
MARLAERGIGVALLGDKIFCTFNGMPGRKCRFSTLPTADGI